MSDPPRRIEPFAGPVDAEVTLPGSKSITNRALVCAALASGTSELHGVLEADDTAAMIDCLRALGATIAVSGDDVPVATVSGTGGALPPGPRTLDARLSGTTARFVLPLLGLGAGPYRLDGGAPLRARPMADGLAALAALGASVTGLGEPGHLPVEVAGPLTGESVTVPGDVSSQFLSGLLLAAPASRGGLAVSVPGPLVSAPYVAMTVAVMEAFGASVGAAPDGWTVAPGGYTATDFRIEPDASAASYFAAAAVVTGGRVRLAGLTRASLQGDARFLDVLAEMGAEVAWDDRGVEVRAGETLRGVTVDLGDLSDTAQTLAVVATFADGPTEVTGIGFIRAKETDRIAAVVTELHRLGITARETDDGFVVEPGAPAPGLVRTYDDHRMAMSFALLGLRHPGIRIDDPGCVAKTFPGYFAALDRLRPGGAPTGRLTAR